MRPERARAARAWARALFRILVEQQAGGHQVSRHRVGGGAVQSREFTADLGRQLLGFDVGGDGWDVLLRLVAGSRLDATGPVGTGRARWRAPGGAPSVVAVSVLDHVCLSTR